MLVDGCFHRIAVAVSKAEVLGNDTGLTQVGSENVRTTTSLELPNRNAILLRCKISHGWPRGVERRNCFQWARRLTRTKTKSDVCFISALELFYETQDRLPGDNCPVLSERRFIS